ncbi:MAG: glycosyltransferase [Clostridia bacterium]|nr:glycosyltransferase [Clostridia bacterium]
MIGTVDTWLIIAGILIFIDLMSILSLAITRTKQDIDREVGMKHKQAFVSLASGKTLSKSYKLDAEKYLKMRKSINLPKEENARVEAWADIKELEKKYIAKLKKGLKVTRSQAAFALGRLGTTNARLALEEKLLIEKNFTIKLFIANALSDIGNPESLPILINSLMNSSHFYRSRVNMLIADFGQKFHELLPSFVHSEKEEIRELIVDFAEVYYSDALKDYLLRHINEYLNDSKKQSELTYIDSFQDRRSFVCSVAGIISKYYPKELKGNAYLNATDVEIRKIAIRALGNYGDDENIKILLDFLEDSQVSESTVHAISNILERKPIYLQQIVARFLNEKKQNVRASLAEILSLRMEYFIAQLTGSKGQESGEIIEEIVKLGKVSEIADYLNTNKDENIEKKLMMIVKRVVAQDLKVRDAFSIDLSPRLALQLGLRPVVSNGKEAKKAKDKKYLFILFFLILANFLIIPVIFIFRHQDILFDLSLVSGLRLFVKDFNYYFAYYSISINFIYFALLILSFLHVRKQKKMWEIKDVSFLFKRKMLPSISIVAPAYNEEMTIIENVNSLLNLKYPDEELVVVNDGSLDGTLQTLIKEFKLKKVDRIYSKSLETKPVKGIYLNPDIPKLIVVDKMNGGKADALNAGINISSKEYICSIDSDSILEDDALLKLVSAVLDEDVETPALGGNVFPVNGCIVDRGVIQEKHVPRNWIGKFQTVEYIRAFMAGRLGWSYINNLLIISGAFGLFRRERGISVGGYLTSSGQYGKDTVGEDMEIVVRISRRMREMKKKYRIRYAFNANCWTEVPEDLQTLKKQRYRWQRGLIELMYFHKKMIFNLRYKSTGLLSMPYYFIFEIMGPIFEVQGYIAIFLAIILGVMYWDIAILLFVSVIMTGTLVSISSLIIAEQSGKMFGARDTIRLLLCAFFENFGIRQYFSILRVRGYINVFTSSGDWEKAERKGFGKSGE